MRLGKESTIFCRPAEVSTPRGKFRADPADCSDSGFHYQINHVLNGNEAKLVDFVKMARTQIKATISKLPTAVPTSLGEESPAKFEEGVKEIKDILSTERHELGSVRNQVEQPVPRQCLTHPIIAAWHRVSGRQVVVTLPVDR